MRSSSRAAAVCAALLVIFVAQSVSSSVRKSATSDEPAHIAAGLSYLHTRSFQLNLQHPPLIKELSAASLWLAGGRYPDTPQARQAATERTENERAWVLGWGLLAKYGADRVMFWARIPMIAVAVLLGLVLFLWGRELLGEGPALGAVFLYALDPTMVAHSYLVTTDVGLATFVLLFLCCLWRYVQQQSRSRLLFCGLSMGLMLGAKYSAVAFPPVAALLLLAALAFRRTASPAAVEPPRSKKKQKRPEEEKPRTRIQFDSAGLRTAALAFGAMCLVAVVVIWAIFLFHGGPLLYLEGFERVNADHNPDYLVYMAGALENHFLSYFAVCYLLKEPLAGIALAIGGLWLLARSRQISGVAKLFLLVPPAVLFAGYSISADDYG